MLDIPSVSRSDTLQMASDRLPDRVDVVLLGTGLPESILAAACARSGLTVLHLDNNDYYGGQWASFHLRSIVEWANRQNEKGGESRGESVADELVQNEDEIHCRCPMGKGPFENVDMQWHCKSDDEKPEADNMQDETTHKDVKTSSREHVEMNWRKFSLDLIPKILLSCGEMVEILCASEVSRYVEFKCVDRLLCLDADCTQLERVPCSRAEIFQSETISVLEKRQLMKFLQFCMTWLQTPEEYQGFETRSFLSFLESRGHSPRLQHYINDVIAILHPNANTIEGLHAVSRFLDSVGRYGNSPFLWPIYGSGELPQCFSRLCAVYSGVYCLNRPVEEWIIKDKQCVGIVVGGERVQCEYVICDASYVPSRFRRSIAAIPRLHRALLIAKGSVKTDEDGKEHTSAFNASRMNPALSARLIEVGHEVAAAPKGYFVSHLTGRDAGNGETAKEAMQPIVERLYSLDETGDESSNRPTLLFSLFFDVRHEQDTIDRDRLPTNVAIVAGPDESLDYASVVNSTREIFTRFWQDRDFLPRKLRTEEEDEGGDGQMEMEQMETSESPPE